jgi:hypothetical protein
MGQALLASGVVLACWEQIPWQHGEAMMEYWSSSRLRATVCTLFYKTKLADQTPDQIEIDYANVPRLARLADDLGLLKQPMLKNTRLDNFKIARSEMNDDYALWRSFDVQQSTAGPIAIAQGNAILRKSHRVADGIFFTWQTDDGHWEIFHVTQVNAMPLYLDAVYEKDFEFNYAPTIGPRESLSSFTATISFSELPPGVHRIAAWACDYRSHEVALIPGYYSVDTATQSIKPLGLKADAAGITIPAETNHS